MPRDYLDSALIADLKNLTRRTTLAITLGDGATLRFATGDVYVDGVFYSGKLAPVDELNLELTRTSETINLQITNIKKVLGQNLINTPNVLNNTKGILGCYFKNLQTGAEWHDVKLPGIIEIGDIDNDWIPVFFKSKTAATKYYGKTIGSCFPDAEVPVAAAAAPPPAPVYDDLSNINPTGGIAGMDERYYSYENRQYYGRYNLPQMNLFEN